MCIYTVTKGTNGDNVPKCPAEEMGTNLPLSITRGLSPVPLSLCLFVKEIENESFEVKERCSTS